MTDDLTTYLLTAQRTHNHRSFAYDLPPAHTPKPRPYVPTEREWAVMERIAEKREHA